MTCATSVIDDCINKLTIRGKHKEKKAKTRKKGHSGKHTGPKKWSGARRPAGTATTALHTYVSDKYQNLINWLCPNMAIACWWNF